MANKNNKSLNRAKNLKKDEFYTQLSDIESELKHYRKYFKNKTILCNCDDPRKSNFFHYFSYNFESLGLKKLITTCYKNQQMELFSQHNSEKAIWLEYNGDKNKNKVPDADEIGLHHFDKDGDFRSDECIKILKQSDIVVTNPPFSLFREYMEQLIEYKKKFIIIGNQNNIGYIDVFKLLKKNEIWLGNNTGKMSFQIPDHYQQKDVQYNVDKNGIKWKSFGYICWFTNLDIDKRHENLICHKRYNPTDYPKYDNYNAISVNKIRDIPVDYDGMMGVPITIMSKFNHSQFELIGIDELLTQELSGRQNRFYVKDKRKYARIVIKHKRVGK